MQEENAPQRIDYGIILSVMLLAIIGIVSLFSTTYLIEDGSLRPTIMQVVWYALGAIVAAVIMMFDSQKLWKLTNILFIISILALIYTLIFYDRGLYISNGARSWINLPGGFTIQPSEFVKIPYIMMLGKEVTQHNAYYSNSSFQSDLKLLGKIALITIVPVVLIILQNDLGTALVFIAISFGITILSGISWKILGPIIIGTTLIATLILIMVVFNREFLSNVFGFQEYQFNRIDTWLNPLQDTSASSYQVTQAFKAIGSGGVFGKGLGVSEVYVPVRESDMIIATIGENFGFLGSTFLIFVYFILIYYMIRVVYDTRNEFYAYIATGVIMMITFHVFENIGMNIGLLPVTGIPLPFISQGGSALMGNMMGIGLIMSMRFHHQSYYYSGDGQGFHGSRLKSRKQF